MSESCFSLNGNKKPSNLITLYVRLQAAVTCTVCVLCNYMGTSSTIHKNHMSVTAAIGAYKLQNPDGVGVSRPPQL